LAARLLQHLHLPPADMGDLALPHNVSQLPRMRALYTAGRRAIGPRSEGGPGFGADFLTRPSGHHGGDAA
jgi:hypothetical protein